MKGLDLDGHEKAGRFVFVDGLEGLFLNANLPQKRDQRGLRSPDAADVEQAVSSAIEAIKRPGQQMRGKEAVLIIDGLDLYLAATEAGANSLQETIGEWREVSPFPLVLPSTFSWATFRIASIIEALPLAETIPSMHILRF